MKRQQKKVGKIVRIAMAGCGFDKAHLFPPKSKQLALYSGLHISLLKANFSNKKPV